MKDRDKTREQLIHELVELRQRIAELKELEAKRKQAEEELRETRDYLDSLLQYANAPIIVWDPEFRITRFNHAFEHLAGYTADEVIGKELGMLFPEVSQDESLAKIRQTLNGEFWELVEIPILRKDGGVRIALWNSANIYDRDRKTLLATIAQGQDITERKQAEKELQQSEENLRAYLESAPDGIYINDLKGVFLYGNKKAEGIMGYKKEELIGKSFLKLELLQGKHMAKAGKLLALNAMGKPTGPDEFEMIRKDGSHVWVEIVTSPIKQQESTVVISFVRDIIERKQAEEKLQEAHQEIEQSEHKYRGLVENMNDGYLVIQNQRAIFANQRATEMLGYTLEDGIGKPIQEFLLPEVTEEMVERYKRRLRGETAPQQY